MRGERLVYLKKLGAEGPVAIDLEKRRQKRPEERRRPKVSFVQGTARRYRLRFEKTGPSAFVGHLDLLRLLPRVFRRLDLPVLYSQGFHPKPDLTFGPALSLGIASLDEHIDVRITADLDLEGLCEQLTAHAPARACSSGAASASKHRRQHRQGPRRRLDRALRGRHPGQGHPRHGPAHAPPRWRLGLRTS